MRAVLPGAIAALVIIFPAATGCSSQKYIYDFDTRWRFTEAETFNWQENAADSPPVIRPIDEALKEAVSRELESRGLQAVDNGGDLLAAYHTGSNERIVVSSYGYDYWPSRWSYGGYIGGAESYKYPRGALIIDLVDRRRNQLIWRGSVEKVFRGRSVEKQMERINSAVKVILADYPPPYRR